MSLIRDAMKAAERERAGRSSPGQPPEALEGFFPYVAGSPGGSRSTRRPAIVLSAAAVALLTLTGWLMWPAAPKTPSSSRPPIILPPPVTVAKTPPAPTPVQAATGTPDTASLAVARLDEPAGAPRRVTSPSQTAAIRPETPATPDAARGASVATDAAEPIKAEPRTLAPRVDYEGKATALFEAGDIQGAREQFELATRFAPNARAWTNYGVTLQRLGDFAGATAAYRSAIGIDANYLEAWLYQGRLAVEQGDLSRAIPLFQRALVINPRNADANVELARLEHEAGNWTEARRFAEAALRGDATNVRAYWYLGVASDALKDVDGAIRGFSGYLQYVGDARDQASFIGWARTRLNALRPKP